MIGGAEIKAGGAITVAIIAGLSSASGALQEQPLAATLGNHLIELVLGSAMLLIAGLIRSAWTDMQRRTDSNRKELLHALAEARAERSELLRRVDKLESWRDRMWACPLAGGGSREEQARHLRRHLSELETDK